MDADERYALVTRNAEEVVAEGELRELLSEEGRRPTAYIGFEPSGLVHMGWALVAAKIRDLCAAGFRVIIFWADWHAYINDKLGGDIGSIRTCARYMEDCFRALGVPDGAVEYRYASDILEGMDYWETVIKVAKATSLSRVKRAMTIMGRSEDEAEIDSSKLFYPILQAADIFRLGVDLSYAGMDQRRANMLARDAADRLHWKKPIALHTPLLPGLAGGDRMNPAASKMSKSHPDSSISIHDGPDEVRRKMAKAFCPPDEGSAEANPVLMICRYIVFPTLGRLDVDRPERFGGPVSFASYGELAEAYFGGRLHPADLKKGAAEAVIECLRPVSEYFEAHPENLEGIRSVLRSLGRLRSGLDPAELLHRPLHADVEHGLRVADAREAGGAAVAAAVGDGLGAHAAEDVAQVDAPADDLLGGAGAEAEGVVPLGGDEHHVCAGRQQRPAPGGLEAPAVGRRDDHVADPVEPGALDALHHRHALGHAGLRPRQREGLVHPDAGGVQDVGEVAQQARVGVLEVPAVREHPAQQRQPDVPRQRGPRLPQDVQDDLRAGGLGVVAAEVHAVPLARGAVVVDDQAARGHPVHARRQLLRRRGVHHDDQVVGPQVAPLRDLQAQLLGHDLGHPVQPARRADVRLREAPGQRVGAADGVHVRVAVDEDGLPPRGAEPGYGVCVHGRRFPS